jgi:hypothetical protein
MNSLEYARAPDSFWATLPSKAVGVTFAPFETSFGPTDEELCFYRSVLIGRTASEDLQGSVTIRLTPTLDPTRQYPWPALDELLNALEELLRADVLVGLGCEADIDQAPVMAIKDAASAARLLGEALEFCAGTRAACPSFRYDAAR